MLMKMKETAGEMFSSSHLGKYQEVGDLSEITSFYTPLSMGESDCFYIENLFHTIPCRLNTSSKKWWLSSFFQ